MYTDKKQSCHKFVSTVLQSTDWKPSAVWLCSGLHSRSRTTWWMWGAYDFTFSMCLMFVSHDAPLISFKITAMRLAVSSAQSLQNCLSAFFPQNLREGSLQNSAISSAAWALVEGKEIFWWMCKNPPLFFFRRRQATGQPSSELGINPRLTRSAMSLSCSCEGKNVSDGMG